MNNKITTNISNDLIQIRMNIYSDTTTYKTENKLKMKNEELKIKMSIMNKLNERQMNK